MNKQIALKLSEKAAEIAKNYSNPDRPNNQNAETFEVYRLVPLSEFTAAVVFHKSSGKNALAFLYWVDMGSGYWGYFFPRESHLWGMRKLEALLQEMEIHNFGLNFVEKKIEKKPEEFV